MNNINISVTQKFAIWIIALMAGLVAFFSAQELTLPLKYPDFVTGCTAWIDATKFQDLIVMPLIILFVVASYLGATYFFSYLNEKISVKEGNDLSLYILIGSIPIISYLSSLFLYKGFDIWLFNISYGYLIVILSITLFLLYKKRNLNIQELALGLFSSLLIAFIPLYIAVFVNRLPIGLHNGYFDIEKIKELILIFFIIVLISYIYLIVFKYDIYKKTLIKIIIFSQILVPFLFFSIYPSRLSSSNNGMFSYETTIYLKIFIISLFLISIYDITRRLKNSNKMTLEKLFSPFTIIAIMITLKYGTTASLHISQDDYHFGENLLGWWTYTQGYIPYIDYIPPHGFINNDLVGFFNLLFYDGSASNFGESYRITSIILTIFAFFSIYLFSKNLLFSFLTLYFLSFSFITQEFFKARIMFIFLIPFIALWSYPKLLRQKTIWIIIWIITAPIVILAIPPQGLLLVGSSGIFLLYFTFKILKEKDFTTIKYIFITFIFISIIYVITPLGVMLISAIEYVLINGSINQIAYGIPWNISWDMPNSSFLYEVIKMLWVIVPILGLILSHKIFKDENKDEKFIYILPILFGIIFIMLLIPYSMGRIDPGSLSRAGHISILALIIIFPIVLWHYLEQKNKIYIFLSIVIFSSIIGYSKVSLNNLFNSTSISINVGQVQDFRNTNLKNLGIAVLNPNHLIRLEKIDKVLSKYLDKKEVYVDLTSRNAQYFYLNRKPIIPTTAPYNMPSKFQQQDAIHEIEKVKPKVALLFADNIIHDGGGLGLRNNYLFKYILKNYVPIEIDGYIYGFRKDLFIENKWNDLEIPNKEIILDNSEKAFAIKDLQSLSISWGKSFKSLNKNMTEKYNFDKTEVSINDLEKNGLNYKIINNDPSISYNLNSLNLEAKNMGLLVFDFKCNNQKENPKLQIFWWGDDKNGAFEKSSIFLNANNGKLIIPLDSNPRWQLLDKVNGIRIDLDNANACELLEIENLKLYSRE